MKAVKAVAWTGGLVLVAVLLVLRWTGDGPQRDVLAGSPPTFPARGALADDTKLVEQAAKDVKLREDLDLRVLWAGDLGSRRLIVVAQGTRLVAMRRDGTTWKLDEVREGWRGRENGPVRIAGAVLLPAGDWRALPLADDDLPTATAVDGLVDTDQPILAIGDAGRRIFATPDLTVTATPGQASRIAALAPDERRLVHGALVAARTETPGFQDEPQKLAEIDVRDVGGRRAAIVGTESPFAGGIGIGDERIELRAGAEDAEGAVAAGYVGAGDDERLVLVTLGAVQRARVQGPERDDTLVEDGPIAVVDVPWDVAGYRGEITGLGPNGTEIGINEPERPGER